MSKSRSKFIPRVVCNEGGIPGSQGKHVILKEKPEARTKWEASFPLLACVAEAPKVQEQGSHFSPDCRPLLSRLPSGTGRKSGQP